MKRVRKAFSMIELIFVIVVLGIVASLGAEMIAKVYHSYIIQKAQHNAYLKTELAALQVANRLGYLVPGTLYRIENNGTTESFLAGQSLTSHEYKGFQWVAADMDGFNYYDSANNKMGWSGFCDVDNSTSTSISTPGSDIATAGTIISNLGGDINNSILYFPYTDYNVSGGSGENITLDSAIPAGGKIKEHYKLAWTSYAVVRENDGNMYLYYNFSPVPGVARGNTRSLLLANVGEINVKREEGGAIRFKVCAAENIGEDFNISACKERTVLP